jgi:tetratricopeptide (TPR) repeat protein
MEEMKSLLLLISFLFSTTAFSQPAEAQLWRCGARYLSPEDRVAACTAALPAAAPDDPAPWHNRGVARLSLKDWKNAVLDFSQALRRKKDAQGHMFRGIAFAELGEYERGLLDMEEALRMAPKDAEANNAVAWTLATAAVPGFRDGKRAVELAKKACELTQWREPGLLDTLAAAYAESGDFAEAVRWQEKALSFEGFAKEHKDAQERLALYRKKRPFRHAPG